MTDTDLRGLILQELYRNRSKGPYKLLGTHFQPPIEDEEVLRICEQLKAHGYVEAIIPRYVGGIGILVQVGITALGVDVVESGTSTNLRINLVQPQQNITVTGSTGVVIGNNNQQSIQNSVQELVRVIESSAGTPEAKAEAKSRLRQFLEHPLLAAVAGGAIGLLA